MWRSRRRKRTPTGKTAGLMGGAESRRRWFRRDVLPLPATGRVERSESGVETPPWACWIRSGVLGLWRSLHVGPQGPSVETTCWSVGGMLCFVGRAFFCEVCLPRPPHGRVERSAVTEGNEYSWGAQRSRDTPTNLPDTTGNAASMKASPWVCSLGVPGAVETAGPVEVSPRRLDRSRGSGRDDVESSGSALFLGRVSLLRVLVVSSGAKAESRHPHEPAGHDRERPHQRGGSAVSSSSTSFSRPFSKRPVWR